MKLLLLALLTASTFAGNDLVKECQTGYSQVDGATITPKYLCTSQEQDGEAGFACISTSVNGESVGVVSGYMFNGKLAGASYGDHGRGDFKHGFTESNEELRVTSNYTFFGLPVKKTLDIRINKSDLTGTLFMDDADSDMPELYNLNCEEL